MTRHRAAASNDPYSMRSVRERQRRDAACLIVNARRPHRRRAHRRRDARPERIGLNSEGLYALYARLRTLRELCPVSNPVSTCKRTVIDQKSVHEILQEQNGIVPMPRSIHRSRGGSERARLETIGEIAATETSKRKHVNVNGRNRSLISTRIEM